VNSKAGEPPAVRRITVAETVRLDGRGLHGGEPVRVLIHPADGGIALRCGGDRVRAVPPAVTGTRRCTRLGPISTVEHLMSAFAGLGITDAEVELSWPELPALDGSAAEYVAAIERAGVCRLGFAAARRPAREIRVAEGPAVIRVSPGTGRWSYTFDTGHRWPGRQTFTCRLPCGYTGGVAPARTIAFLEEIPAATAAGLGRGLDERSAVIIGPHGYHRPARFPDEPARHKLLDLMGDLYLAGVPVANIDVHARLSGHRLGVRAAALLHAALP
jgi:UDP-3-O-[3-hydroxymyristoyl] N-acetylglucosamine deacetylase